MKSGPVIAMILLIFLGMWLVLQPALRKSDSDLIVRVGAMEILLARTVVGDETGYRVVSPASLRGNDQIRPDDLDDFLAAQLDNWNQRPALERHLLGFFNITSWATFGWVTIGLLGQVAFFGRMLIQWVISERSRISTVPEAFWWLSFFGGVCLFAYFVWRVDIVGVLGQSTGVVIYARNLRLIHKHKA
ncbi:MAG: lipid-A-disaccharide synthase N-terminal domain-containing protein, partial [Phycisphaerales bacterium]